LFIFLKENQQQKVQTRYGSRPDLRKYMTLSFDAFVLHRLFETIYTELGRLLMTTSHELMQLDRSMHDRRFTVDALSL